MNERRYPFYKKARTRLFVILTILMFIYGFSVTLLGPIMPDMIDHYSLGLAQGGLFETFKNVGGILAAILGIALFDAFPKRLIVAMTFVGYIASLLLVGRAPAYVVVVTGFFFLGATTRAFDAVTNAFTADLYPERGGKALNMLHAVFGGGALAGPLFSRYILVDSGNWSTVFTLLAVGALPFLLIYAVVIMLRYTGLRYAVMKDRRNVDGFDDVVTAARTDTDGSAAEKMTGIRLIDFLRNRETWLMGAVMFFYVGHQGGFSLWVPMFAETRLNAGGTIGALIVSLLWLGIIFGRLASSRLVTAAREIVVLRWGLFIGGLVIAVGFFSSSAILLAVSAFIGGVATGSTIPLAISVACRAFPSNSGGVSAFMFLNASISRTIFPFLIGLIAENASFAVGVSMTWITLLVCFILSLFPSVSRL